MKSAAPLLAGGAAVVALVVGIFVFSDQLGLTGDPSIKDDKPAAVGLLSEPAKKSQGTEDTNKISEQKMADTVDKRVDDTFKDVASKEGGTDPASGSVSDKKNASDQAPSFDVVRVEVDGSTVVAGKAAANSIVELLDGSKVLAKAKADAHGDWVMVLAEPLKAGVSELSLAAKAAEDSDPVVSKSSVTVALSDGGSGELLVVKNIPGAASTVLAKLSPEAEKAANKPDIETLQAKSQEIEQAKSDGAEPQAEGAGSGAEGPGVNQSAGSAEKVGEKLTTINAEIAIEAVELENDVLFVAGEATPAGSKVRLYVDNRAISDSESGETGRFLFDGPMKLATGNHQVRVDLLSAEGIVLNRAEVSFAKKLDLASTDSEPSSAQTGQNDGAVPKLDEKAKPDGPKKIIIRRGDNLWEIARRVYGAGIRYSTIYDSNSAQIRNPNLIYPGQVFELPAGQEGWEQNFDAVDAPEESKLSGDTDVGGRG